MKKLIFASHNKGKVKEIRQMLEPFGIQIISAEEADLEDVEETGSTFEENAALKAISGAKAHNTPCLADDSGLCVTALNGRPGVYSARFAPNRDFDKGMDMLLEQMRLSGSDDRSAYFACVLVLAFPNGEYRAFEGRVNGTIAFEKSGSGGFGFDPVFVPDGYKQTFAVLPAEVKNKISHRANALEKFVEFLKSEREYERPDL